MTRVLTIDNMNLHEAQQILALEEMSTSMRSDRHESILAGSELVNIPYAKYIRIKNSLFEILEAGVKRPISITQLKTSSRIYNVFPDIDHLLEVMNEEQLDLLSKYLSKDYLFNLNSLIALIASPVDHRLKDHFPTIEQRSKDILQAKFIDCWNIGANLIYSSFIEKSFDQRIQNIRMQLKMKPEPAELQEMDGHLVCTTKK